MGELQPSRFEHDTEVEAVGDGLYRARIDPGWWIARGPNGGYVAAILLRAMARAVGESQRAPRSLTVHYLAPPREGPVQIETRIERSGRSMTTCSARMVQGDRPVALALAAFSLARPGFEHVALRMPEAPPPERCTRVERSVPIHERYEVRRAFGEPPFSDAADATSGGWIRLREPRVADAPLVAAYADSFPPSVFATFDDSYDRRGLPTVDLTVHFRAPLPLAGALAGEFTLAVFRSRYAKQGFVEEDGEVWSRDGVLLAQSRQLAVIL